MPMSEMETTDRAHLPLLPRALFLTERCVPTEKHRRQLSVSLTLKMTAFRLRFVDLT